MEKMDSLGWHTMTLTVVWIRNFLFGGSWASRGEISRKSLQTFNFLFRIGT